MDGVDPHLVVGNATVVECTEGMIVTPGGLDVHVHFIGADQVYHALSNGLTTMIGGGLGVAWAVDSGAVGDIHKMLRASEGFPMNFGLFSRGNSHNPAAIEELIAGGVIGVKIHEDFGAMPTTIDCCLAVADNLDFQVQLHTDTLNESGFYERTWKRSTGAPSTCTTPRGRVAVMPPTSFAATESLIVSPPPPTRPTLTHRNTFDEHLDMTMSAHGLRAFIPEDVAHAESRVRRQSISAEDVLHDMGAISMLGSDSQGMGRINEVVTRTWQLAGK